MRLVVTCVKSFDEYSAYVLFGGGGGDQSCLCQRQDFLVPSPFGLYEIVPTPGFFWYPVLLVFSSNFGVSPFSEAPVSAVVLICWVLLCCNVNNVVVCDDV